MALLHYLKAGGITPGAPVTLRGLRPEFERVLQSFTAAEYDTRRGPAPPKSRVAEEAGRAVADMARDCRAQVVFVGQLTAGLAATAFRAKQMRWPEVWRVFEQAGVNALPIVSLISLLVGLIIAFEAAQPMAQFGAQIFIANLIGLVMIRELGPVMTAILLAGRSGSAFAAELGTMKVNEELNALQTMGLDPVRFLVVQRVAAGVLLTPLLSVYSMFMGVLGGVIVLLAMGFPASTIYNQLTMSVAMSDVLVGTLKGAVFGLLVSGIGCLRGLQTKQGPSAVGESTTRSVVSAILLVILADALFSVLLYVLE